MFSIFPHGRFGIGLLLMRLAACLDCLFLGWQLFSSTTISSMLIRMLPIADLLLAVLFFLGLLTPLAGTAGAIVQIVEAWVIAQIHPESGHAAWLAIVAFVLVSMGTSLLGPGAYSTDALLFGHREIIIPYRVPRERK
jgi:hypothetical protein